MKILNVLCEGATEEHFVKKVLAPYLKNMDLITKARQVTTNRKMNQCGGMTSYQKVKNDFILWKKENSRDCYSVHYYTCMFDFYQLPTDFPGYYSDGCNGEKVKTLEMNLAEDLAIELFIPYIQLHEYEALVFAGLDYLIEDYPDKAKAIAGLKSELVQCHGLPEAVNNHPDTAPSKRLERALGKYNKVKSGAMVAKRVGVDGLRKQCPHFDNWISRLVEL